MKKLIGLILCFLLMASPSFAKADARARSLKDAADTAISSYALSSGVAVYSETLKVDDNMGFITLLVIENKAGGAGDVDISAEYSIDGTNWYTAYTSDMGGTLSAEGNIVTALQNTSRWMVHTARLAPYLRYKFDPDADSQITASMIYQRDR